MHRLRSWAAGFLADRGERSAQPPGGPKLRKRGLFYDALAPAPFRREDFIFVLDKIFLDQSVPVNERHGVVLADAKTVFLVCADHVLNQISEQAPIVQMAFPGLHVVVIRAAV